MVQKEWVHSFWFSKEGKDIQQKPKVADSNKQNQMFFQKYVIREWNSMLKAVPEEKNVSTSISVSATVIVSNSNLTQIPQTKIRSLQYMPAWKAGGSHQEQRRMTCLIALFITQHFSILGWKLLVLATLTAQAPTTRGLKRHCSSHGLPD